VSVEELYLHQVTNALGHVRVPGSKSISNRALLLAALAEGVTLLTGVLESDDTVVMRDALAALGVGVEPLDEPGQVRVTGVGRGAGFPVKAAELFMGNSGTSARSLTAALALADGSYVVQGVARMHERPIGDLVDALRVLGGQVEYLGKPGFPPLSIGPRAAAAPQGVRMRGDVSSQFVSAVLMALGWTGLEATVEIEGELTSRPYVELTLGLMKGFGVAVGNDGGPLYDVPAGPGYVSPGTYHVEGDASSASYFLAAGALGGGPVRVEGVGAASAQGDVRFADVLGQLGATVEMGPDWIECSGRPPFRAFDLDMSAIPDAAMTAAVLALFAEGPCTLRRIASWRVKETDRISAMATELKKFGARVQEGADFLRVFPPHDMISARASTMAPVSIDTYDDHRMAMCFSLAAFGPRPVRINDPGCVAKTFPDYFAAFGRLVS
jgi:3-phosphoshikimate 1-carboxyvinyltransferase